MHDEKKSDKNILVGRWWSAKTHQKWKKKRGISDMRERERIRTQLAEWRRLSSREVGAPKGGTPFYLTAQEPAH